MKVTLKWLSSSWRAARPWLAGAGLGLGLGGCAAPLEKPQAPAPAKVLWGQQPGAASQQGEPAPTAETKPDQAPPAEPSFTEDGAIDLDALAARTEQPKPGPKAQPTPQPGPKAQPGPRPKPEPKADLEAEAPASDPLAAELRRRRAEKAAREKKAARSEPPEKSAAAAPASPSYTGTNPCQAVSFSVERVRQACASGGRAAAKRVMKDAIGKATATGQSLRCSDCHANQRDYTLKSDAVAELKRWLAI